MSLLEFKQLNKVKGNHTILPEINLSVEQGQFTVIQCHSELGSLLVKLIVGLDSPSNGAINFNGVNLNHNFKQMSPYIAVALIDDGIYEKLSVKDYLLFIKQLFASTISIDDTLQKVGLHTFTNSNIEKLSLSERKRLHLARCIVQNPKLIILEEPEQNLDIESQMIFRGIISGLCTKGVTVLMTTAYLHDAISISNDVYTLTSSEFKKVELTKETAVNQEEIVEKQEIAIEQIETEEIQQEVIEQVPLRLDKIPAKVEDKIILFDPTEIHFIESQDGMSMLHVKNEMFPCAFTMNDLEAKLRHLGFFRCHRSYIVNLQRVREVITWTRNSFSLILDDSKKSAIPLSKNKYDELKQMIGI